MSPASSGGPPHHQQYEVEKYIGACLITQNRPPKFYNQRWGGLPLISWNQSHHHHHQTPATLSRLVVHTQGAPLILTKRFNNNNNNTKKKTQNVVVNRKVQDCGSSVASDESSANSDNSLPRIIKPRKRRKKDRKPTNINNNNNNNITDGCCSTSSDSSAASTPDDTKTNFLPFIFAESETPRLHHSFEEIVEEENEETTNNNQSMINCQCSYCDPAGQIWDVDRDCYSPFLTDPKTSSFFNNNRLSIDRIDERLNAINLGGDSSKKEKKNVRQIRNGDLEVSTEIVTSLNGHRDIEIKFFSLPNVCGVGRDKNYN